MVHGKSFAPKRFGHEQPEQLTAKFDVHDEVVLSRGGGKESFAASTSSEVKQREVHLLELVFFRVIRQQCRWALNIMTPLRFTVYGLDSHFSRSRPYLWFQRPPTSFPKPSCIPV